MLLAARCWQNKQCNGRENKLKWVRGMCSRLDAIRVARMLPMLAAIVAKTVLAFAFQFVYSTLALEGDDHCIHRLTLFILMIRAINWINKNGEFISKLLCIPDTDISQTRKCTVNVPFSISVAFLFTFAGMYEIVAKFRKTKRVWWKPVLSFFGWTIIIIIIVNIVINHK